MKQILYTSCEAGKSLDGAEGFRVRAVSAGLGAERIRAAKPYMAYDLPTFVDPSLVAPELLPVRLALLRTPELGPVLCHGVSAGEDPTTHRTGNFFSHLLLDLPPTLTAREAIKTWESNSWQRADGRFDVTLPDVSEIRVTNSLTDEALRQLLSTDRGRKMFRFVLAAMLTTEPGWRIFLAASSRNIALCIYGLTRALPEGCQRTLTFSTYEMQPLSCPARVVGTLAGDSAETDMPSSCYIGRAVGYNSITGRASRVGLQGAFVDYATTALASGDCKGFEELRSICDQCGIDRPELLNLVCHAEFAEDLAVDEIRRLVAYPRFLSHLLAKPKAQRQLLGRFAADPELANALVTQITPLLKENPEAFAAASASLTAAAKNGAIDAFSLASKCGPALADALDGGSGLDAFIARLLDCPPERLLGCGHVLALFRAAVRKMTAGEIRNGLEAVLTVRSFLDRPVFSEERLATVARSVKTLMSHAVGRSVLETALAAMLAEDDSPDAQRIVESLFGYLGPVFPCGPVGLYRSALEQFRNRNDFWNRQHLICAMVAVGLGATSFAEYSRDSIATAESARDLAVEAARRSPREVFAFIDRQSCGWPDEAHLRWNLFAKLVRPHRLLNIIVGTVTLLTLVVGLCAGVNQLSSKGSTVDTGVATENRLLSTPRTGAEAAGGTDCGEADRSRSVHTTNLHSSSENGAGRVGGFTSVAVKAGRTDTVPLYPNPHSEKQENQTQLSRTTSQSPTTKNPPAGDPSHDRP